MELLFEIWVPLREKLFKIYRNIFTLKLKAKIMFRKKLEQVEIKITTKFQDIMKTW